MRRFQDSKLHKVTNWNNQTDFGWAVCSEANTHPKYTKQMQNNVHDKVLVFFAPLISVILKLMFS